MSIAPHSSGATALKKIADNLWIHDGTTVSFYGFPFPTRMTVIRLSNGGLWLHSPTQLTVPLIDELLALGEVNHLVSPNKIHHVFLQDWQQRFPAAKCYAPPGLKQKRPDIRFTHELSMTAEREWAGEIGQTIFKGSPLMEEVVFFHRASKTLIVTDLIENFAPHTLGWGLRLLARIGGVLAPNGKTPADWRLSFLFGKAAARSSLAIITAWAPNNIIVAHGDCIYGKGEEFIKKSFDWV